MLDVCIPIYHRNANLVPDSADAWKKLTDVPCRFLFIMDGGMVSSDMAIVTSYLVHENIKRYVLQLDRPTGFAACMEAAFAQSQNEYMVIAPPHIRIEDPKWFGKMQEPFIKDNRCMLAAAHNHTTNTEQSSPFKVPDGPVVSTELALIRRKSMLELLPVDGGPEEFVGNYAKKVFAMGGTVWCEPSIRYGYIEHEKHEHSRPTVASDW